MSQKNKKKILSQILKTINKLSNSFNNVANLFDKFKNTINMLKSSNLNEKNSNKNTSNEIKRKEKYNKKKVNLKLSTKIYKVRISNINKSMDSFAYRIYLSSNLKALCMGPYENRKLATEIKNKIIDKLKNYYNLPDFNSKKIVKYYQKIKQEINIKYPPLKMKRNKMYYKDSKRKIT